MKRIAVLIVLALLSGLGLFAVSPAAEADAQALSRNRVFHSYLSERKEIKTATQYNGKGHIDKVKRGRRPPDSAGKIRSVWVPKGCTLITNNWPYQTAWVKGDWANIGKYPFVVVSLKMDCGFIKRMTG